MTNGRGLACWHRCYRRNVPLFSDVSPQGIYGYGIVHPVIERV